MVLKFSQSKNASLVATGHRAPEIGALFGNAEWAAWQGRHRREVLGVARSRRHGVTTVPEKALMLHVHRYLAPSGPNNNRAPALHYILHWVTTPSSNGCGGPSASHIWLSHHHHITHNRPRKRRKKAYAVLAELVCDLGCVMGFSCCCLLLFCFQSWKGTSWAGVNEKAENGRDKDSYHKFWLWKDIDLVWLLCVITLDMLKRIYLRPWTYNFNYQRFVSQIRFTHCFLHILATKQLDNFMQEKPDMDISGVVYLRTESMPSSPMTRTLEVTAYFYSTWFHIDDKQNILIFTKYLSCYIVYPSPCYCFLFHYFATNGGINCLIVSEPRLYL